jgi:hypothetical protein
MAADSELKLPGNFQPGKAGLQRHDLMDAWRKALVADRAIPGPGISESQTAQGRIMRLDDSFLTAAAPKLPFQVSATPALLRAEPGIVGTTAIEDQEIENPADGTWNFYAKVVIDDETGEIISEAAVWGTTFPANTSTDYHREIASVEVLDGEILGPPFTLQFTYGPIAVVVGGGFDSIWTVRML